MCFVSNVLDYGRQLWPHPPYVVPVSPIVPIVPWEGEDPTGIRKVPPTMTPRVTKTPTPEEWEAFRELIEKARKFDEIANQPDCEDPEKVSWLEVMLEVMKERLDELERLNAELEADLAEAEAELHKHAAQEASKRASELRQIAEQAEQRGAFSIDDVRNQYEEGN